MAPTRPSSCWRTELAYASPRSRRRQTEPIGTTAAYGLLTRTLHWLTVALLAVQLWMGYALDVGGGRGRGRGRGRGLESGQGRGRGRGGDTDLVDALGDDALLTAHVVLGVTILVVTLARLLWRRHVTLPPWATSLSPGERVLAHWTERTLYVVLIAMPLSGLWLVLVSDDALAVHIATHVALFAAVAAHLGLVLKHQLINRDGLLRRML